MTTYILIIFLYLPNGISYSIEQFDTEQQCENVKQLVLNGIEGSVKHHVQCYEIE